MNKEEKEAIEKIKILSIGNFITWFNTDGCVEMEIAAKTVLNLIQKQEKIINDIKFIAYNNKPHITQEKIIEYFKKEVEKE